MIYVAAIQVAYFLITGIWPLVSIRTFMRVTGPKTDIWLVKTVGLLVSAIGGVLLLAWIRGGIPAEVFWLAVTSAAALTAIDVVYVLKRVIAPIYLADAAIEILLIAAWWVASHA